MEDVEKTLHLFYLSKSIWFCYEPGTRKLPGREVLTKDAIMLHYGSVIALPRLHGFRPFSFESLSQGSQLCRSAISNVNCHYFSWVVLLSICVLMFSPAEILKGQFKILGNMLRLQEASAPQQSNAAMQHTMSTVRTWWIRVCVCVGACKCLLHAGACVCGSVSQVFSHMPGGADMKLEQVCTVWELVFQLDCKFI